MYSRAPKLTCLDQEISTAHLCGLVTSPHSIHVIVFFTRHCTLLQTADGTIPYSNSTTLSGLREAYTCLVGDTWVQSSVPLMLMSGVGTAIHG